MSVPQNDEDPRITRTRAVVHRATLELLSEVGVGGLTMEGVAARAGVGRSTLYRRWADLGTLVRDAVRSRPGPPPAATSGDPIERVAQVLEHLVAAMADPAGFRAMSNLALAAETDAELATLLHDDNAKRRRRLIDAIDHAIDAGAIDQDTDATLAAYALAGAIVFARMTTPTPLTPEDVPALMRQVIGVEPDQPSR